MVDNARIDSGAGMTELDCSLSDGIAYGQVSEGADTRTYAVRTLAGVEVHVTVASMVDGARWFTASAAGVTLGTGRIVGGEGRFWGRSAPVTSRDHDILTRLFSFSDLPMATARGDDSFLSFTLGISAVARSLATLGVDFVRRSVVIVTIEGGVVQGVLAPDWVQVRIIEDGTAEE